MWAKASISPLFELAREAGEAEPVGEDDRPHIHRPCGDRDLSTTIIRGEPATGTIDRATNLYSVDPRDRTMMQSCASAAKLRGGGSILDRGTKAMSAVGSPPPRFVNGGPRSMTGRQNPVSCLSADRPSRRCSQHNALRNLAGGHQAPQACHWPRTGGDEQLARQSLPLRRQGATIIVLRVPGRRSAVRA